MGALLMSLEGGGSNFSPDGTRSATIVSDGLTGFSAVNVWDATSGALVATLVETAQELGVVSAEFSPDGSLIVTAAKQIRLPRCGTLQAEHSSLGSWVTTAP